MSNYPDGMSGYDDHHLSPHCDDTFCRCQGCDEWNLTEKLNENMVCEDCLEDVTERKNVT